MRHLLSIALISLGLSAPAAALASTWEIDPSHSSVQFSVRHMMVSNVRGDFGKVTGTVELDEADVTKSAVRASIDVASVNTRDAKRDEHLRAPDFFDVAKHPSIEFQSRKIEKAAGGKLRIHGVLTIKGISRGVVLEAAAPSPQVKDPWGNTRTGLTATTRVNRKDYGIEWNKVLDGGGVAVGNEVAVQLDVELVKKAAGKPGAGK